MQQIDLSKQYLTPQRILAVQTQLLGFVNEEVIPPSRWHHVTKFATGQESPPPPSPSKMRNTTKKNHCALDSSINKQSK
jgi:hypothetical protein